MQNWDHLTAILSSGLNRQPTSNHPTIDFSRVRRYLLSSNAPSRRQTILTSTFSDPHPTALISRHAHNTAGLLTLTRTTPTSSSTLTSVSVGTGPTALRQIFHRIPCPSPLHQGDARLRYFRTAVLPLLLRPEETAGAVSRKGRQKGHTLVYVPSYFDFLAVRGVLLREEASFVSVTEYARVSEVGRGRARFVQGREPLMLYTGRAHFFGRHRMAGVRHLVAYGPPEVGGFIRSW